MAVPAMLQVSVMHKYHSVNLLISFMFCSLRNRSIEFIAYAVNRVDIISTVYSRDFFA